MSVLHEWVSAFLVHGCFSTFAQESKISHLRQQKSAKWVQETKQKTYQPWASCTSTPRRCKKASATVVSWWKLQFEQQPWQQKRKGRLLSNCPGPKCAQAGIQTLETAVLLLLSGSLDTSPTLPSYTHPCPWMSLQYVHNNSCLDRPVLKFNLESRTCACRQPQTQQTSFTLWIFWVCFIRPNPLCCVEAHHFQLTHISANETVVFHYVSTQSKCNDN